jgi:hypothetical protein
MQGWKDNSELWAQKDSITTVVEANGYSVWDIRLSSGVLYVELCQHLNDEQMSDLCCQFTLVADYAGEGTHGSNFALYANH